MDASLGRDLSSVASRHTCRRLHGALGWFLDHGDDDDDGDDGGDDDGDDGDGDDGDDGDGDDGDDGDDDGNDGVEDIFGPVRRINDDVSRSGPRSIISSCVTTSAK